MKRSLMMLGILAGTVVVPAFSYAASQVGPVNFDTVLSGWANPSGLPPATVDYGNLIVKSRKMTTTFTAADCPPNTDFLNPQGNGKVVVEERDFATPFQFQQTATSLPPPVPPYELEAAAEDDVTPVGTTRIAARGIVVENGLRFAVITITETPVGVKTAFNVFAYYLLGFMPRSVMGVTAKHFPSHTMVRQDSNVITIKMCKERGGSSSSTSSTSSSQISSSYYSSSTSSSYTSSSSSNFSSSISSLSSSY